MTPNVLLILSSILSPSALAAGASVSSLSEGDLVISELMANPASVRQAQGEWLEIHNTTAGTVDLQGLVVTAQGTITVSQSVLVSSGGRAVLAVSTDSAANGGVTNVDYGYSYDDMALGNRSGTVILSYGSTTFDMVNYTGAGGFPAPWGASISLDRDHVNAVDNDTGLRWCRATSAYATDLGTPGEPNDTCATPLMDLTVGSLAISEVMTDPNGLQDRSAEWFEFVNLYSETVNLYGVTVSSGEGESYTYNSHLYVEPGEHVLLAPTSSASTSGLSGVDIVYGTALRLDGEDELSVSYEDTVFDTIQWDATYPLFTGVSLNLDPNRVDSASNDVVDYWCSPSSSYHDDNLGTPGAANDVCLTDADNDGATVGVDCDDHNPAAHPFAEEICDGIDNDCDGGVDEDVTEIFYADADSDGYGDEAIATEGCEQPSGYASNARDCDDTNSDINPRIDEVCDGIDNNCDGRSDEGVKPYYYADADGDGYGDPDISARYCTPPSGYVSDSSDCNDSDATAYPDAREVCDDVDNDCDNLVDEYVKPYYYIDTDGDGYGVPGTGINTCTPIEGRVTETGDCDDSNAAAYPGAAEICDEADNDCDGDIDEGVTETFYADADGDGYGSSSDREEGCTPSSGYGSQGGDCDDSNAAAYPGAEDVCDGIDNDCDGVADEDLLVWYADADGDGSGDPGDFIESCEQPEGYVDNDRDCDDSSAEVGRGAEEICDGIDNDCDGEIDEDVQLAWYADADGDGYGSGEPIEACEQPSGYIDAEGDCDDSDGDVYPAAEEVCDEIDNDCDGGVDEGLTLPFYPDADGDGYGDGEPIEACEAPSGYAEAEGDCDDADSEIYPGALELCDGVDNDCNGEADTDAVASTYALTFSKDRMLKYVHTETGEVTIQSGPYADVGEAHNAVAGSPISGRLFIHSNDYSEVFELDPATGTATSALAHAVPNVCGLGLTDDGNLFALSAGDNALYYFDIDGQTVRRVGDLGVDIYHCGLVYSTRNQVLYGITVDGANDSWVLRIDTETGEATRLTQLSPAQPWNTAGITYDELTDTIYVVSEPGIFQVDMDPARSGGDNVTLVSDEIDNDNLSFFATSRNAGRFYTDADGDGFGDPGSFVDSCDWPEGTVQNAADCDDLDEDVNPLADDVCDGVDNDCDGAIDEDAEFGVYYDDADGDGYGSGDPIEACEQPEGTCDNCDDPNDEDPDATPEACDGIDNDGDGVVDNGFETSTWYEDVDGDGFGDPATAFESCLVPEGAVDNGDDCDDFDASVHPDADDVCDGFDNDCDLDIDEDAPTSVYYPDADGDGFGGGEAIESCAQPEGTVTNDEDPDDTSASAVPEICDGVDNDGDGVIDNGFETSAWYVDADGDGFGAGDAIEACAQPDGTVDNAEDCDDTSAQRAPGFDEVCDGIDNDCDLDVDEGLTAYFYADVDADGYGDAADSIASCDAPEGYVADDTDCDDSLSSVNPGMEEACDELDNDCDDEIDEDTLATWYADLDRDTHGDAAFIAESCEPVSIFDTQLDDDCDDRDAAIYPGAEEVCDGADNDCDTQIDEGLTTAWYEDDDGDGYGDSMDATEACEQPDGFVDNADDCDDRDAAVHPGAEEVCDYGDNDCDSEVDEGVTSTWYADADHDGYGNGDTAIESCEQPDGYVDNADDCNDCDSGAWEAGTEACEVECDCDGEEEEEVEEEAQVATFCSDETVWVIDDSGAMLHPAVPVGYVHPAWTTELDEADWIWSTALVESPTETERVRFFQAIDLPEGAELASATLEIAADNMYAVRVNDGDTLNNVDARAFDNVESWDITADLTDGSNDLVVDVTNKASSSDSPYANPAGLNYCVTVEYFGDAIVEEEEEEEEAGDTGEWVEEEEEVGEDTGEWIEEEEEEEEEEEIEDSGDWGGDTGVEEWPVYYADRDHDGYGDPDMAVESPIRIPGFVDNDEDCDDRNADVHLYAEEICDGVDNDCDGTIDEGFPTEAWYQDSDGDGYGDPDAILEACAQPEGTSDNPSDPDDSDDTVSPEICDGIDNDGDGEVDEALLSLAFDAATFDSDLLILSGDARQDSNGELLELVAAEKNQRGTAMVAFPMPSDAWKVSFQMWMGGGTGADGLGLIMISPDETDLLGESGGGLGVRGLQGHTVEFDTYQNSYWGDPNENHVAFIDNASFTHLAINSSIPEMEDAGWISVEITADQDTITVHMDGTEVLSADLPEDLPAEVMLGLAAATGSLTNDHLVDDLTIGCPAPAEEEEEEEEEVPCETAVFYEDRDGDGYGDALAPVEACEQPEGTVDNADDCDDEAPERFEETPWYADVDADGYGDAADGILSCGAPEGYVADDSDCDDSLSSVNPGMEEACDSLDNDCDDDIDEGVTTEAWVDADGDGHGDSDLPVEVCAVEAGYTEEHGDCDDSDAATHPGAEEVCDERDNDCDDDIDEGAVEVFYADADVDGHGDPADSVEGCEAPEGYIADNSDCDDTSADAYPGAPELCNEQDDDCDGDIDNDLVDADGSGEADCREVAVVLTQRAIERGEHFSCEGQTALARELDEMDKALSEMGLSMVTLREDEEGIAYGDIAAYPVVVYHNLGWAVPGSTTTAQAIGQAAAEGKGLVMMGDDVGFHAYRFTTQLDEHSLADVVALESYRGNGGRGKGAVRSGAVHPVTDGLWGEVQDFAYKADIDRIVTRDRGEEHLMYIDGTDYPAVWAEDGISQRTVTMAVGLYSSHDCPLSDDEGLIDLRALFQNAVWWTGRY